MTGVEVVRELVHVVYISNIRRPQRPAWSVWYLVAAPGLPGAAAGSPKHTPQSKLRSLLPESGKHINRMAGPYNSSKPRACVEPVRSESHEGDSQTVSVGMKGMQGIEAMLRSMLEVQEKLVDQG